MKRIPRIEFSGSDLALQAGRVFAENVFDLWQKVERGNDPAYEKGFFHTSTLDHPDTCYYADIYSRDAGRGIVELARMGFVEEALLASRYIIKRLDGREKWLRMVASNRNEHMMSAFNQQNELDGNALLLLGLYATWKASGKKPELAREFFGGIAPVVDWIDRSVTESAFDGLMPCASEMSGNPNMHHLVYPIYPNYGMMVALRGLARMAGETGMEPLRARLSRLEADIARGLERRLISRRTYDGNGLAFFEALSPVPEGCWINAIDERDGSEYMFAEWGGTAWPAYHWTRQLAYIFDSDAGDFGLPYGPFEQVNRSTYEYILSHMEQSPYFRKYGFVSNTAWTGTAGRHDDTMCGYGHGFFLQAALLADAVNVYSKLTEGLMRLAYDGNVTKPLSYEMNPWVFHECFNYENYEDGRDHTFGALCHGRFGVMDNAGDEGNLVQEAEAIKAMLLMAGISDEDPARLRVMPRIPWDWDSVHVVDYPIVAADGRIVRVEYTMRHERWLRKCSFDLKADSELSCDVRLGPFPSHTGYTETPSTRVEHTKGGSWIWVSGLHGSEIHYELALDD